MNCKTTLSAPLRMFLWALASLWTLSLAASLIQKYILHLPASSWYPLFRWEDRFSDLTIYQPRFRHFHTMEFFTSAGYPLNYPAPVALAFEGFLIFGKYALDVYLCACVIAFGLAGVMFGKAMILRGVDLGRVGQFVGVSLVLSYPIWFLIDRSNIELVNWSLVAMGIAFYWRKRWNLAAIFIGVAISFKIFPFVYLGLLLSARKYRAILLSFAAAAVSTVASTWILGPTYSAASAGVAKGLAFFKTEYILHLRPAEIGFDHSLFAIVKLATFQRAVPEEIFYLPLLNWYMTIAAAAGIAIYFLSIIRLPRANQILALTVASILLPPVSYDYTLVHLYIPWAALVLVSVSLPEGKQVPGLTFCFVCMALVMAPGNYINLGAMRFSGILRASALLALFFVSLVCPFFEQEAQSVNQGAVNCPA